MYRARSGVATDTVRVSGAYTAGASVKPLETTIADTVFDYRGRHRRVGVGRTGRGRCTTQAVIVCRAGVASTTIRPKRSRNARTVRARVTAHRRRRCIVTAVAKPTPTPPPVHTFRTRSPVIAIPAGLAHTVLKLVTPRRGDCVDRAGLACADTKRRNNGTVRVDRTQRTRCITNPRFVLAVGTRNTSLPVLSSVPSLADAIRYSVRTSDSLGVGRTRRTGFAARSSNLTTDSVHRALHTSIHICSCLVHTHSASITPASGGANRRVTRDTVAVCFCIARRSRCAVRWTRKARCRVCCSNHSRISVDCTSTATECPTSALVRTCLTSSALHPVGVCGIPRQALAVGQLAREAA
jgi:hypothetical protein